MLEKFSDTIDVLDLNPGNSRIRKNKRGQMFTGDLRDIKGNCEEGVYVLVFGNWALCYLNDVDVDPVLQQIKAIMKPDGVLVFKEPTTVMDGGKERLC